VRSILILFSLLITSSVSAVPILVDDTKIIIPNPEGFVAVTPKMSTLYEFQKQFIAPMNVEFQTFISKNDALIALKNEIPDLTRRFSVQTAKTLVNITVTKSDFIKLKNIIKSQNDEILKKAEKALGKMMGDLNSNFSEQYDMDLALSVSQMVPLPVHEETDRTLAYSMYVKYDMKDENGNPSPFVSVVTATFIHIKGKVLFMYSYAEESSLEWSKMMSAEWTKNTVKANPSDLKSSIKESLPASISKIDWSQVGVKALTGAFIGLIIGLDLKSYASFVALRYNATKGA